VFSNPVTFTSTYQVAPDRKREFCSWATNLLRYTSRIPGCLGGGILFTAGRENGEWHIVYRFSDEESAALWESSISRRRWEQLAAPYGVPSGTTVSAENNTVFPAPARPATPPPPKWKLWLVNIVAVFPPVLLFNITIAMYLQDVNVLFRTLGLVLAVTAAVTWILMPRLQRLFKKWLNPSFPGLGARRRRARRNAPPSGRGRPGPSYSGSRNPPRVSMRAEQAYR
jgi:antibiotic biosynthesis monooxygenase (ABM) superfamily enzyme